MIKRSQWGENYPFLLFTISILILLTLPKLIQDGMFLDGMLYTCVSHNLGNGIGTFWFPVYSPSYFNAGSAFFHEQPPLVIGIQSLFFRILGDSMYVERLYVFITMCLTAFSIKVLWNIIFRNEQGINSIGWLPVILWITIPTTSWSYSNNMMENSMGLFALVSVIFICKSFESERTETGYLLLSGLFVFFATMSKGVPGLFPVAVPFFYWIIYRKKTFFKVILQILIIFSVPAVLYLILFRIPESRESLSFYVTKRLLGRINDDPTVGSRFYIITRLLSELLPLIILSTILLALSKLKKIIFSKSQLIKSSLFLFLTGMAASVPLTLTLVQRGFYLVPSFPYFAVGFSILIAPGVLSFRESIVSNPGKFRILQVLSVMIFLIALSVSLLQKGKTVRDRDMLNDVHNIGNTIPSNSEITVDLDIASTYVLECYFIRYYNISLFIDTPKNYRLVRKGVDPDQSENLEKVNIETRIYDLYQKKENKSAGN